MSRTISTTVACDLAGLTYRRFDYWVRCGVFEGLGLVDNPAPGSGNRRRVPATIVPLLNTLGRVGDAFGDKHASTFVLRLVVEHFHEGRVTIADGVELSWSTPVFFEGPTGRTHPLGECVPDGPDAARWRPMRPDGLASLPMVSEP